MADVSVRGELQCEEVLPLVKEHEGVSADQGSLMSSRNRILATGVMICVLLGVASCLASSKAAANELDPAGFFIEEFQSDRCHLLHHVQGRGCKSTLSGKRLSLLACKKECIQHKHCLGIEHHIKDCWLVEGNTCDFKRSYHERACYEALEGVRDPEGEGISPKAGDPHCQTCYAAADLDTCKTICTSEYMCKSFSYGQWGSCSACCLKTEAVTPGDKATPGNWTTYYQRPCEKLRPRGRIVESRPCFDCASKYKVSKGQVFDSGKRQACGPAYMGSDGQCKVRSVRKGEGNQCSVAAQELKAVDITTTPGPEKAAAGFTPRGVVPPDGKLYFSTSVDTRPMWPSSYRQALGDGMQIPAFAIFHQLPFQSKPGNVEREWLRQLLSNTASLGGIAYLTTEPRQGLWAISVSVAEDLAWLCAEFENEGGAGCIVRFGHEMNGGWYEWGQQPGLYIEKFRIISQALRRLTKRSGTMWAPSSGQAYPFPGGPFSVRPGSPDFFALDTNKDGILTMSDDMFTPFYPGDDFVDWVGVTLTYFGDAYPYDSNELPLPHFLVDNICGKYGDASHQAVPNFYEMFSGENSPHRKPFAIAETAAFWGPYLPQLRSNLEIKQNWWRQLFLEGLAAFPNLKMVMWFEIEKDEGGISWTGSIKVDWRLLADPAVKGALQKDFEGDDLHDKLAWQADVTAWVKESVQSEK